jgi:hypothetical protein
MKRRRRSYYFIPMKGQRFGRLSVLRDSGQRTPSGAIKWLCRCDCGKRVRVWSVSLRKGWTKSCGCLTQFPLKHGKCGTPEYRTWGAMRERCRNKENPNYGARGISVCERWQGEHGFENFLADMGTRPAGTSIDRKNVDGNYEPDNCRWATPVEQANNRRNNAKAICNEAGIG